MFTKYAYNPVLGLGVAGAWDDAHIQDPTVIYRNNKYYMYYTGHDGTNKRIGLATSPDGITFTKYTGNPVLDLGAPGTWDDLHIHNPTVIYRNNKYYMYYTGHDGSTGRIGLATSPDGITFTKYTGNPVLDLGAAGTWDDLHIYNPSVIYRNHKYYIYYNGSDGANERIGLATSPDGITFTKYTGNPVLDLGAAGTWDEVHAYIPNVIYRNHKYYIYYKGYSGSTIRVGLATSPDGITFTKYAGNPVLDLGAAGTWDDVHVYSTSVIYRNNKYYMYYSGYGGAAFRIGLATSPTGV